MDITHFLKAGIIFGSILGWLMAGCAPEVMLSTASPSAEAAALAMAWEASPSPVVPTATQEPQPTITPGATPTWAATLTPMARHDPPACRWEEWQKMPVVPNYLSDRMEEVYQQGLRQGNSAHAFSVVGDCQNVPSVFLGVFEDPVDYRLGEQYAYLQETIDWFGDSFEREGEAVSGGFNVATVLSPLRADPKACLKGESPLVCELRLNRPSVVFVSMETWWAKRPATVYENYMRQVLDVILAHGAVPILVTKADNLEGDHSINLTIARLACEYEIPMYNFWLAAQPLPKHGLWSDGFHLTVGQDQYDNPQEMLSSRPVRNLMALRTLEFVWKSLNSGMATP